MWANIIFIVVVFIIAFAGITGYTLAKDNGSKSDQTSRSEYVSKLEQLSKIPSDWKEPVSAMCYEMAAPPDIIQYTCPVCGETTIYSSTSSNEAIKNISYCRNLAKKIAKIDVKLDESQLCRKCNPKDETRELCLIVKANKKSAPHKTCNISEDDINLLYEYSEGLREHSSWVGKIPLIKYKNRLEELLGKTISDIK